MLVVAVELELPESPSLYVLKKPKLGSEFVSCSCGFVGCCCCVLRVGS